MLNIASTITGYVSISGFVSLICVLVGVTSSTVKMKIMHLLLELKSLNQSQRERKRSIMK